MAIINEKRLGPRDIKSMRFHVSEMVLGNNNNTPVTGLEGKFSVQYAVANALLRGNTGMQAFSDEKVNDPDIREFMKKISLVLDQSMTCIETAVEIETNSGEVYSKFSDVLKEIPEIKIKAIKVKEKYLNLCSPVVGSAKANDIMESILSLDKVENMKEFLEMV
jgi:2-methylcitrate dehydratase PrpD